MDWPRIRFLSLANAVQAVAGRWAELEKAVLETADCLVDQVEAVPSRQTWQPEKDLGDCCPPDL